MKRLIFLAAALAIALPVTAATPRPWTVIATPAPAGSFIIGNPKARVRLVEYASYTCPHCRHFAEQSAATLKAMIRSGSTSLEIRSSIHDKIDIVAAMLARCAGASSFPAFHDAIFAHQEEWLPAGIEWDEINSARIALYPQPAQLRALADGAGLTALAATNGVSASAIDQCFATPVAIGAVLRVAQANDQRVHATPTFEINGRLIEHADWSTLEPMLRAAGAK